MPWVELSNLGFVALRGPDARTFLQGQITSDVLALDAQRAGLGAIANAQGRVLAIALTLALGDALLLVVPRAETTVVRERLQRYVLRAKVAVTDESAAWCAWGALGAGTEPLPRGLPAPSPAPWALSARGALLAVRLPAPAGIVVLGPQAGVDGRIEAQAAAPSALADWALAQLRAGLAHIVAETRELFVPQMLNLELLGAVSLAKGCYTGQEVIARTQHLGRIKRRMLRARCVLPVPAPGTPVLANDELSGHVVNAAADGAGGCELLATVSIADREQALVANGARLERLTLPYAVPELDAAPATR